MGKNHLPAAVPWIAVAATLCCLTPLCSLTPAAAQTALPSGPSFRMETEIYQDDANAPATRHKILFDDGVVYDLQEQGGRLQTVFDPTRHRVILLDTKSEVQTEVSTEHLIEVTAQLAVAARQNDKAEAFGLDAEVTSDGDQYAVAFGACQYQSTSQAVSRPEQAAAYHELTVWAARLNVLRHRGAPPFARMKLGEQLAADNRVPLELNLTIQQGVKKQRFRAHHLVLDQLSEIDRRAIRAVGDRLATYRKVPLEEFPNES